MEQQESIKLRCGDDDHDESGSCHKPQETHKAAAVDHVTTTGLELLYRLHDAPPWYTSLFLGIQQCFLALGGIMGVPLILASFMCMGDDDAGYLGRAMVLNTMYFISGIGTIMQVTFGTRLPILQGGSFAYLPPALAILSLPHNKCPAGPMNLNLTNGTLLYNDTDGSLVDGNELWMKRMREVQGAIIVATLVEILLGVTGAIGFLIKFIGPLTVAPAIALLGLTLFEAASAKASTNWGIAFFTISALVVFSQYLRNTSLPLPLYSKTKRCRMVKTNFIKLFPVLITIVIAWLFCLILTASGVLTDDPQDIGYWARTDARINVMINSPWFRLPYPCQWGLPVVSAAAVVGMIAGVLSSVIESIGDYYACARLSGAPPVPRHAVNRGISIEGLGSLVAGLLGIGSGITSYSENIGAIAITRVASRWVLQIAGIFLIIAGMIGKFGAVLVMIPDPVIGGLFCVMFATVAAVGLSNLQHVDLNSSRNLFVVGFPLFMGLMVPIWVRTHSSSINTGSEELDQIIIVLLGTSIFVGGALAAFFDNTLPGTLEERGMIYWRRKTTSNTKEDGIQEASAKDYDLPFSTDWRFSRYIPFLPQYDSVRKIND